MYLAVTEMSTSNEQTLEERIQHLESLQPKTANSQRDPTAIIYRFRESKQVEQAITSATVKEHDSVYGAVRRYLHTREIKDIASRGNGEKSFKLINLPLLDKELVEARKQKAESEALQLKKKQ